jgi:hypothetical protein
METRSFSQETLSGVKKSLTSKKPILRSKTKDDGSITIPPGIIPLGRTAFMLCKCATCAHCVHCPLNEVRCKTKPPNRRQAAINKASSRALRNESARCSYMAGRLGPAFHALGCGTYMPVTL